jgi:type II secretory pathway component HofQ
MHLILGEKDNSSSSGEEIDESPTIRPQKVNLTTPSKLITHNSANPQLHSDKKETNTPSKNLGQKGVKRAAASAPNSGSKRVKTKEYEEDRNEINKFKLSSKMHKIEPENLKIGLEEENAQKKELEDELNPPPEIINYVRNKPWEEAKKYEMEAMVQMHSAFYEQQREQFHAQRQTSNVIFLRKFNNWIKSVLINQTCHMKGKYLSVLDI